jgi:hypothetical protein
MGKLVLACLIQFALLTQAHAWGPEGHSIVAEIAQRRLSPEAAAKVREILGENASLASIASWADDYHALHLDSAGWHFVDIPLAADDYEEGRDCTLTPQGDCVIHELTRSLRDLSDPALTAAQRRDALKFVVHLVGDINQPLHTVGELRGYNDLAVCYFSSPAKNDCVATNLHIVWDVGLIRATFWDWGGYVDYLETDWLPAHNDPGLDAGTPVDWALEAHRAARGIAVAGVTMDAHLGADYLAAVRPTLDRQLAVAGLRLARTLNDALK